MDGRKMKIGILTFHDGINHGGFFQAYSTFSLLRSWGHDVEIINYKNSTHWFKEYKAFLFTKNPILLLQNIKKISKFKKDQQIFALTSFAKDSRKIDFSKYDVVLVGSDIVWNYEWNFLGNDPIYFGNGINAKKLISYAPSVGAVSPASPIPEYVSKGLKKFKHISVRDENSSRVIEKAIGVTPKIVLDPTFIYNVRGSEKDVEIDFDFILVYAYQLRKDEIQATIEYARKNNLKTISVAYSNTWCDYNIVSVGPFEWLGYFKKAKHVLTSTFHGTIFSIKYEKNFATSNNNGIATKIRTILENIALKHRVIVNGNVSSLFDDRIDYNVVNHKLAVLVDNSMQYLRNAIND
jgi:hypothetical protein